MSRRIYTVNSRKFDGGLLRSWKGEFVSRDDTKIDLVGTFKRHVQHSDLGVIEAGTVSRERFYLGRWYNYFIFEHPAGTLRNYYINICMPPEVTDDVIDYVDLDIDLVVWPDGTRVTLDMKEFEANSKSFPYPDSVITNALETLRRVQDQNWLSVWKGSSMA